MRILKVSCLTPKSTEWGECYTIRRWAVRIHCGCKSSPLWGKQPLYAWPLIRLSVVASNALSPRSTRRTRGKRQGLSQIQANFVPLHNPSCAVSSPLLRNNTTTKLVSGDNISVNLFCDNPTLTRWRGRRCARYVQLCLYGLLTIWRQFPASREFLLGQPKGCPSRKPQACSH